MTVEAQEAGTGPLRLLLIEDNPGDARLFRAIVSDGEFGLETDVRWERSLQTGLAAAREKRPDLLVLDLGLPDADGLDAVQRVTRAFRDVPVVVLTGRDDPELGQSAVREGAQDYLRKGEVEPRDLAHTLRYALLRSRTDREIRRREQRLHALLSNVSDVISVIGPDGTVLYSSASVKRILGYEPEELEGENILEYFHPGDRGRVREGLERLAATPGDERIEEARFRHADGSWRVLEARGRRPPEGADVGGVIVTTRDVTERVERERALAERVKEQSCLHDVSRTLREGGRPLGERLREVVTRIPAGWQHPEVAVARLRVEGEVYATEGFDESDSMLETALVLEDGPVGDLAVGYREERPEEELGPFLLEERRLLEELAGQIQTELSRQKTRRRMHRVVETMTEAVTIVAPDGTITFANTAARRLFGDGEAGYVGEDLTDFVPQVKRLDGAPYPPEELPFQTVMRTGEQVTGVEHLIERTGGERIVVSVNAAPIREGDDEIQGVVLTVRNVTDRHREAEWRHLLESSVEAAAHGILITDRSGEIVWTNPAFTEMTGYRREEVVGETLRILQSGQQDAAFYEELWETILAGETWEGEIVNRRKDGTLYTERQNIEPVRHRGDEITHFIAVKEDITEQRESEKQLRESEARHRTLVETMNEATVIVDGEGQITFANVEAEELLGLERSELAECTYDDPAWAITAPDGGPFPASELPFQRVLETGEPVRNVEHAIVRPDGTRTVLSVNAAPMDAGAAGPERVVATMRDVTEQKRLEAQLKHQALHDPLTGLANRTLFKDRLEQALARSRRRDVPMGLLMIDIDGFKRINDHLGHTAGDAVLEQVARRLEAAVRDTDTVARWGGDEFVLVLPELDRPAMIESLQTRLREGVEAPIRAGGEELEIKMTVGGVVQAERGGPGTVETRHPEDLVRFVDLALHRAKSLFTGGFYRFDPTDDLDEIPDLRLEQDLRRGIEAGEIEVFYQPIYRLEDERLWGLEALARWRHPERGLVSPGEFIPLAERVGLIGELGDAVRQQSYRQLAAWTRDREAASGLKLAINLSARQLQKPGLTDRMREGIEQTGVSLDRLVVEVTETAMMKTAGQAREVRALGVDLFIDDFGTGYSTFTYLRELEPDGLKIDMSLVHGLPESTSDAAIVESMLTLADRLGLMVIAEGIETEAQLRTLRELGCPLAQGFLLGRPVPADQIEGLLEARPRP